MLYQPAAQPLLPAAPNTLAVLNRWLRTLVVMVTVALFINVFFPRYAVQGHSMEPQVYASNLLLTSKLPVLTHSIQRGELVVARSPRTGQTVIKRVIGLPGERVDVLRGQVYINGHPLREDYVKEHPAYTGSWLVGPRQYFILGDNRNDSLDSADYGPVEESLISAVVLFRYWPLSRFNVYAPPNYPELSAPR